MGERFVSIDELKILAEEVIPLFRAAINANPQSKDTFSYEALRDWASEIVEDSEDPMPNNPYLRNPGDTWSRFMIWKMKAEELLAKK